MIPPFAYNNSCCTTYFRISKYYMNLCVRVGNSQWLFCFRKTGLKQVILAF